MTFPQLPYSVAQGELVYCPDDFTGQACTPASMQAETAAVIEANLFADQAVSGVYGPHLRPAASRFTEEYQQRSGKGHWMLDTGRASAWGPMLRAVMPVGCDTALGVVRAGDFPDVTPAGTRLAESAELDPQLRLDGAPYGPTLLFHGSGRCFNIDSFVEFPGGSEIAYRDDVFIADMFGLQCAFCPTMFATFEPPCLGCSFEDHAEVVAGLPVDRVCPGSPPHDPSFNDSCNGQNVNVGEAVCVPLRSTDDPNFDPNWRIQCDLDENNEPTDHHCEECVYQRNVGFLVNQILSTTDALSRIPMRPSNVPGSLACPYECGAFGWSLWSQGLGLRIPDRTGGQELQIMEAPCSNVQCFADGWHESGGSFCGGGLGCACWDGEDFFNVTTTHWFRWRRESSENKIESCHVCFKQRELCDPANGPCDSNPFQDPNDYHNPSTQMIVDVDVKIRIKLVFDHWGPKEGDQDCGGCFRGSAQNLPRKLTVILEGEWCGPLPFGNRDTFLGYPPLDARLYPGRQNPVSGAQIVSPDGTYPRGSCANLFVDQGLYSDDPFIEPPKRCPSWEGDSGAGGAPTQFWCPPKLNWKWSMSGGGTHWSDTDPTAGANKHEFSKQCWAAQLLKGGCPGGSINFDQFDVRGCDDANCRRGCSMTEDTVGDPCDQSTPRSTPWGCDQCQV